MWQLAKNNCAMQYQLDTTTPQRIIADDYLLYPYNFLNRIYNTTCYFSIASLLGLGRYYDTIYSTAVTGSCPKRKRIIITA